MKLQDAAKVGIIIFIILRLDIINDWDEVIKTIPSTKKDLCLNK
jgi:hypothetical protein